MYALRRHQRGWWWWRRRRLDTCPDMRMNHNKTMMTLTQSQYSGYAALMLAIERTALTIVVNLNR